MIRTAITYSPAIQLKYLEGFNNYSKQLKKAAEQLVNAPAEEKWIEIKFDKGTYEEFKNSGREKTFIAFLKLVRYTISNQQLAISN